MSFNLRSLNVVLSLITRCLNSSNHPQLVRMFYNIKNIVNIYVSIKSININALLLTILIYRIEVYFLRVLVYYLLWICGEFEKTSGTIAYSCQLLSSIVLHCQLLPSIAYYCQLLSYIANYRRYCQLLPTFYCQLEILNYLGS